MNWPQRYEADRRLSDLGIRQRTELIRDALSSGDVFQLSPLQRLGRASFSTGGSSNTSIDSVGAEVTLLHLARLIAKLRGVIGTRPSAEAGTDALALIDHHDAVWSFLDGTRGTGLSTHRHLAVIA